MSKKQIHVAIGSQNPCKIDSVKSAFQKVFQCTNLTTSSHYDHHENGNASSSSSSSSLSSSFTSFELVFSYHNVESKVNDQPIGDDETLQGAKNRALGALQAAREMTINKDNTNTDGNNDSIIDYGPPDFGVGLEGGIEIKQKNSDNNNDDDDNGAKEVWCMAWMAIVATNTTMCTFCKHESSSFQHDNNTHNNKNSDNTSALKWGISKTSSFLLPNKISSMLLTQNIELGTADDLVFNRVNSKQGSGTVGILTNHLITRSDYYDHALVLALISFIWPEHYG